MHLHLANIYEVLNSVLGDTEHSEESWGKQQGKIQKSLRVILTEDSRLQFKITFQINKVVKNWSIVVSNHQINVFTINLYVLLIELNTCFIKDVSSISSFEILKTS